MGTSKASRELPARVENVRRRFERWRRTRQSRSRIPEPPWAAAVKVAGGYGIHRTAKAMLLDYYSLKRRVEREAGESEAAAGVAAGWPGGVRQPSFGWRPMLRAARLAFGHVMARQSALYLLVAAVPWWFRMEQRQGLGMAAAGSAFGSRWPPRQGIRRLRSPRR
ncbi:MAG: hypothetical protein NTW96_07225 [Planctomycetia bacterium]|nr:hypothetical protein [Planctomycetia bacterium]